MKGLFFFLSVLFFLSACNSEEELIRPDGNIIIVDREVSGFNKIQLKSGLKAMISLDTVESVRVEASQNLQQYIYTWLKEDNKLVVELAEDKKFQNIDDFRLIVHLSVTNLEELGILGGSSMESEGQLDFSEMQLEVHGGSRFEGTLEVENLNANYSGGSIVGLEGNSNLYSFNASGGCDIGSFDFAVNHLECDLSGGSHVEIKVDSTLMVSASGGSGVVYKGDGTVTFENLTGGSSISKNP